MVSYFEYLGGMIIVADDDWVGHIQDTIIILKEGNLPHPHLPKCNMFVPCKALNGNHPSTEMYTRGRERKFKHLEVEETQLGTETAVFQEYVLPIYMVSYFKYLGG